MKTGGFCNIRPVSAVYTYSTPRPLRREKQKMREQTMGFFSRKEKLDEGLAKTRKGFFAGILDMMNAGSIDDSFYDDLEDKSLKAAHYARIQELAARFSSQEKSLICRELLGLTETHSAPEPSDRTQEYYQSRPCPRIVETAARILDKYIEENPVPKR